MKANKISSSSGIAPVKGLECLAEKSFKKMTILLYFRRSSFFHPPLSYKKKKKDHFFIGSSWYLAIEADHRPDIGPKLYSFLVGL